VYLWEYFRYSALDATRLINLVTELFHCENCDSELVEESDKFAVAAPADVADGEDNARRRRREKLKDLLEKLDVRSHALLFLTMLCLVLCSSTDSHCHIITIFYIRSHVSGHYCYCIWRIRL